MTEYTFTFNPDEEVKFHRCLERLEPGEYNTIKDVYQVRPEDGKYSDKETVLEMDAEAALTFRLGMKNVKIRRARTEEELIEEKRIEDQHKITINVKVNDIDIDNIDTEM